MKRLRPGTLLMVSWGGDRHADGTGPVARREFIIVSRVWTDENDEERFDGFSSIEGRRQGWTEIVYKSVSSPPENPELGWRVLVW